MHHHKRAKSAFDQKLAALKTDPAFAGASESVLVAMAHGTVFSERE
jgi:hypothetical protein